jgi:hypothetical protein
MANLVSRFLPTTSQVFLLCSLLTSNAVLQKDRKEVELHLELLLLQRLDLNHEQQNGEPLLRSSVPILLKIQMMILWTTLMMSIGATAPRTQQRLGGTRNTDGQIILPPVSVTNEPSPN